MIPSPWMRLAELPESWEWVRFAIVLTCLVGLVGVSELVRRFKSWPAEVTRKFVHVTVGILVFFSPSIFDRAFLPLLLALFFVVIDAVAVRSGLLVGIHSTSRFSYGTVYYPLAFAVLIILFWYRYPPLLSLSMLGLAFGDAAAAIVGESISSPHEFRLTSDKKSLEGSLTMFAVTLASLLVGMWWLDLHVLYGIPRAVLAAVSAAVIATAWEALSSRGFDNFTVPLSVAFVLTFFFVPAPGRDVVQFVTGMMLGGLIAFASWRLRFLSLSGSVATFLLAALVFGLGGWKWTIPILVFFVLSSLLSRSGKTAKAALDSVFEKTGTRDAGQVAANGAVAGMIILLQFLYPEYDLYPVFVASIAAVTADTWGTEIGAWVQGKTVVLPAFRLVQPGENGGVSIAGSLGGIAGSAIISASAMFWVSDAKILLAIVAGGVGGALVDSLLGATVQAGYRCEVCGRGMERREHCGQPTMHFKGFIWMTNDRVNWLCAISGAIIAGCMV